MKKSTRRFIISTEAENSNGFRVRSIGVNLADFKNNPLLLWMHKRPSGDQAAENLPLGYWDEIELRDGKITGIPVFDEDDDFAMRIYKKVENGSIRMASAGLHPLSWKTEDGTKWLDTSLLKEASLVDIGSNRESLSVALYNENDEIVTLSDVFQEPKQEPNHNTMKEIKLSAPTIGLLKLSEGDDSTKAHDAVQELITLAENRQNEIKTLKADKEAVEVKLAEAEKAGETAKIIGLVDKAIEDRKITADQKESMVKLAESNFDSAKSYLDSLKASPTAASQMRNGEGDHAADKLMKLSYDDLDKSGQLVTLKEKNLEGFREKFKEKFDKEYQG